MEYFKHTLTEHDFELNPELHEEGLIVGDIIEIPVEDLNLEDLI